MSTDSYESFILVLGTNGTGKTTQVARLMVDTIKRGGRVLVVMPDDMEYKNIDFVDFENPKAIKTFTGIKKTIYDPEYTTDNIVNHLTHCMIVLEDCMSYYGNNLPMNLHRMLIRRRQYHINTIAVGHGFSEMPPKFFSFSTDILLFLTLDNIKSRKNDIRNYPAMLAAKRRIDAQARTDRHYFEVLPQI